jgi:hypothetical protein
MPVAEYSARICFSSGGSSRSSSWLDLVVRRSADGRRRGGTGASSGKSKRCPSALAWRSSGYSGSQNGSLTRIDQIDLAQVPAGITHHHVAEVTIACRNLEPHALQRDRPVATALAPRGLPAKRFPQSVGWKGSRGARPALGRSVRPASSRVSRCSRRLYSTSTQACVAC